MEGYLRAAGQVSRIAVGDPNAGPDSSTYNVPRTSSQKGRAEGAPVGTRGGIGVVSHNVERWEAFLLYGSPIVSSPVKHIMYREDQARRDIATMIFAQITDKYEIPPSAYEADEVFQRCLTFMHKFNIYELRDFQSGHMEPFKNYMFPTE